MMFRIDKGLIAVPKTRLVETERQGLGGHSKKFMELGSTCNPVKFSFFVRTIKEWNLLSNDAVCAKTLENFKELVY